MKDKMRPAFVELILLFMLIFVIVTIFMKSTGAQKMNVKIQGVNKEVISFSSGKIVTIPKDSNITINVGDCVQVEYIPSLKEIRKARYDYKSGHFNFEYLLPKKVCDVKFVFEEGTKI